MNKEEGATENTKSVATYYLTVGAPGAGKSRYVHQLKGQIVCPDQIVDEIGVDREVAYAMAREQIRKYLQFGKNVILDATNVFPARRQFGIESGKSHASKTICLWFDTPYDVCVARHNEATRAGERDSHRYTTHTEPYEAVIRRYCDELSKRPPSLEEGFDDIIRITS